MNIFSRRSEPPKIEIETETHYEYAVMKTTEQEDVVFANIMIPFDGKGTAHGFGIHAKIGAWGQGYAFIAKQLHENNGWIIAGEMGGHTLLRRAVIVKKPKS